MTTYVVIQTMIQETCLMRTVGWVRLCEGTPQWVEVQHDDKGKCRAYTRVVHVEMDGELMWTEVEKGPGIKAVEQVPKSFICAMGDVLVTEDEEEASDQFRRTFNGSTMCLVEEDDESKLPPPPPQMAELAFIPYQESDCIYLIR